MPQRLEYPLHCENLWRHYHSSQFWHFCDFHENCMVDKWLLLSVVLNLCQCCRRYFKIRRMSDFVTCKSYAFICNSISVMFYSDCFFWGFFCYPLYNLCNGVWSLKNLLQCQKWYTNPYLGCGEFLVIPPLPSQEKPWSWTLPAWISPEQTHSAIWFSKL